MLDPLDELYDLRLLSDLDVHFARYMVDLSGSDTPELKLGAALASRWRAAGHVCIDLARVAGTPLDEGLEGSDEPPLVCPSLEAWTEALQRASVVGEPGEYKPLILDEAGRLYLHRYWRYETRLAENIQARLSEPHADTVTDTLKRGLDRLFPTSAPDRVDWQRVAAVTAVLKRFSVISGGPGTGKTSTVVRILVLLLEQEGRVLRIALAAPTGKAAARLQESIQETKGELACNDAIRDAIPEEAHTLHRLLGSRPGSPYFRYNEETPLPYDVVVVDEASMVDLALMAKLVDAVPPGARLILLGDKDQLASVEAGAVLGDICDAGREHGFSQTFRQTLCEILTLPEHTLPSLEHTQALQDSIVLLRRSYRFDEKSGIGALAAAVNRAEGREAIDRLQGDTDGGLSWRDTPEPSTLREVLAERVFDDFSAVLKAGSPQEAFTALERFRVLCALRSGPYGLKTVNALVEEEMRRRGLISGTEPWYRGRPVMVLRNDYSLRLFNGDVGIALPDPNAGGDLRVFFPIPEGGLRTFRPGRITEHETVYAMTVHKSQGSEFERVLMLLPDRPSPVLTRELVYTGVTRAKKAVEVWAVEEVFLDAVSKRVERTSGLRDALWGR